MKQGIYVGYSRVPQEVFIIRSTATRHLVVNKTNWNVRETTYERNIRYFENYLETRHAPHAHEALARLMSFGTADAWVAKNYGTWVSHGRVFNVEEVE